MHIKANAQACSFPYRIQWVAFVYAHFKPSSDVINQQYFTFLQKRNFFSIIIRLRCSNICPYMSRFTDDNRLVQLQDKNNDLKMQNRSKTCILQRFICAAMNNEQIDQKSSLEII